MSDIFLFAMKERSRSYVTEESTKRDWQTPQKQSDMNLNSFLFPVFRRYRYIRINFL